MKSAIKVGDPIKFGQIKKPLTIYRGQIVRLNMNQGGIEIKGLVKILKAGSVGDVVEAEYLGTRKKIHVEILDRKLVKYRF